MKQPKTQRLIPSAPRGSLVSLLVVSSSIGPYLLLGSMLSGSTLSSSMLSRIYDLLNPVMALIQKHLLQLSKTVIKFSKVTNMDAAGHISVLQPHLQWGSTTPT